MSALSVTVESKDFPEGKRSVRFPMATLIQQERGGGKAFATFIPIPNKPRDENKPEGVAGSIRTLLPSNPIISFSCRP